MQIAINGKIIDTKDIYKINKISIGYYDTSEECRWFVKTKDKPEYGNLTNRFVIKFYNRKKFEIVSKSDEKINKIREDIINIWSDNQSTIPSFTI